MKYVKSVSGTTTNSKFSEVRDARGLIREREEEGDLCIIRARTYTQLRDDCIGLRELAIVKGMIRPQSYRFKNKTISMTHSLKDKVDSLAHTCVRH